MIRLWAEKRSKGLGSGWGEGWASSFGSFALKLLLLRLLTQAFNCSCSRFPSAILIRGGGGALAGQRCTDT